MTCINYSRLFYFILYINFKCVNELRFNIVNLYILLLLLLFLMYLIIIKKIDYFHIQYGMYLYYTVTIVCYFVTSSIFKGLLTYHGSMEREIKFNSIQIAEPVNNKNQHREKPPILSTKLMCL